MHYRRMYDDTEMLYAYDLDGVRGDVVVVIEQVFAGELTGQKGRKTKKPFIKFVGKEKKLALNKTNGKAIATMYGNDTDEWVGKPIAIYVTTTEFEGEQRECIRIRNRAPSISAGTGTSKNAKNGKHAKGDDLTNKIADEMARDGNVVPRNTEDDDASDGAQS